MTNTANGDTTSARASHRAFVGVAALLFVGSAAATIAMCTSMSAMGEMPMPGGWTMSMTWMRMPGETWTATAVSFLGMWIVMMAAMMLPALVPMLRRYREAVQTKTATRVGWLTTIAGGGYFFVWTVFGAVAFPIGVAVAGLAMRQPSLARAVPFLTGAAIVMAGAVQFTAWKARRIACCRETFGDVNAVSSTAAGAWRHGVRFGLQCGPCCFNLMVILVVAGVMDLRAMAAVTAAITLERLAPAGQQAARAIGTVAVVAGLLWIARAAALG